MKSRLEFFCTCPSTYELYDKNCFGHLIGTFSKCNKFWGGNLKKNQSKSQKTEFYDFLSFIFLGVLILERCLTPPGILEKRKSNILK